MPVFLLCFFFVFVFCWRHRRWNLNFKTVISTEKATFLIHTCLCKRIRNICLLHSLLYCCISVPFFFFPVASVFFSLRLHSSLKFQTENLSCNTTENCYQVSECARRVTILNYTSRSYVSHSSYDHSLANCIENDRCLISLNIFPLTSKCPDISKSRNPFFFAWVNFEVALKYYRY